MTTPTALQSIVEILDSVRVDEAMHPGVVSCSFETPVHEVASLLVAHRVHCVVGYGDVADDDTALWGVVSDLDVVSDAAVGGSETRTAGSIAATEAVTIAGDENLRRATQLMREHGVSHLVVTADDGDKPIGVLSTLDIAGVIAGQGRRAAETSVS